MRTTALVALIVLSLVACMRSDPRVSAAEDFRQTAFGLIREDEARAEKLTALKIGMSDSEVLSVAGPPSSRESRTASDDVQVETWTYKGELKTLGQLTLEDRKLVQVQVY